MAGLIITSGYTTGGASLVTSGYASSGGGPPPTALGPLVTTLGYGPLRMALTAGYGGPNPPPGQGGRAFTLDSVELPEDNVLRVRFTRPPKVQPRTDLDAATLALNYVLDDEVLDPGAVLATEYVGDDEVVDLLLPAAITEGDHVLSVKEAVTSTDGATLIEPYAYAFVVARAAEDPISGGATNDTCEDTIARFLNPAFRGKRVWAALTYALSRGDCVVKQNAMAAYDQLFLSTASGAYLAKRASERGITKPALTGITDAAFRRLAAAVANNKLSQPAMLEILEVLYGPEATRAVLAPGGVEPYVLNDGDDLQVLVDEATPVLVEFRRADFQTIRRARAAEVAAVLTRAFAAEGLAAYAVAVTDPTTGKQAVRAYSGTKGLRSALRVTGGTAQPGLQFPTNLFPKPAIAPVWPDWTVTPLAGGLARYDCLGDGFYNLGAVEAGDYLVVAGTEFGGQNRGWFRVVEAYHDSTTQYVVVENPGAASQTATQVEYESVELFRPTRRTIYDSASYALVTQAGGAARASIAATAQVVARGPYKAAYGVGRTALAATVTRRPDGTTEVTTAGAHGLAAGRQVLLEGVAPAAPAVPAPVAGAPATYTALETTQQATGTSDASMLTTWTQDTAFEGVLAATARDLDGALWVLGGQRQAPAPTTLLDAAYVEVTSETTAADQKRSFGYRWRRRKNQPGLASGVGLAACVLSHPLRYNTVLTAGGWVGSFWADQAAANIATTAIRCYKDAAAPYVQASSASTVLTLAADAALAETGNANAVLVGGSQRPNEAAVQVLSYECVGDGWVARPNLNQGRTQAKAVRLNDGRVLVMGGRCPASTAYRTALGFTSWGFDDGFGTASYAGPVTVPRPPINTQPCGKLGYGVRCLQPMIAAAGAPQTALNALLLGDYTVTGWVASAQGQLITNGAFPQAGAADNALLMFGVDPADDKLYLKWQHGANVTVTKKTTATRAELMPYGYTSGQPARYYHFAITKAVSGANATFTLYIEGAEAGSWTDTKPSDGANGVWAFGYFSLGVAQALNAPLDLVGITSTVLTAEQVRRLYDDEVGVAYDDPARPDAMPVGRCLNTCEIVAGDNTTPVRTGSMAEARFGFGAVVLPDGRVVVAGGIGHHPGNRVPTGSQRQHELRSAEVYDPLLGHWAPLPPMLAPHGHPVMTYDAAHQRVYVAGGTTATAEYLDLRTMRWHACVDALPAARFKAAPGAAGNVLVLAGGVPAGAQEVTGGSGLLALPAAERLGAGGLNGPHTVVTAPTVTTLVVKTPARRTVAVAAAATASPLAAPASAVPGPFVYDPNGGVGTRATKGTLAAGLVAGRTYPTVRLGANEALPFPTTPCYVVFGFGRAYQVGPVRCVGRVGTADLALDAAFRFPVDVPAGATVTLLTGAAPWVPAAPEAAGSFYLTHSAAGRVAAADLLDAVAAAGIDLEVEVRFPGDRGLGGEGRGTEGAGQLADKAVVWGPNDIDRDVEARRGTE